MEDKGRISLATNEDEILIMADKIRQNQMESREFERRLESYLSNQGEVTEPITIGKTSNALVISGADGKLNVIINPSTIKKCMSDPAARYHGHGLTADIMKKLPDELRNPIMIFKGAHQNSLVAVTALKDKKNDVIVVAVDLNVRSVWCDVNRVTSAYGKENVSNYIKKQFETGNLVAVNVEKANEMLHSLGLQLPQENTFISFDNSIAYTTANVKYPDEVDNLKNIKKENEVMENEIKSIFSVKMYDEERFYENTSGLDVEALCKAYRECEKPFIEMGQYGKQIPSADFAYIQQGEELDFSVEFDADRDEITIFDGQEIDYRTISEAQQIISPIGQAEEMINRLETDGVVFNSDERNLIVNYAYKLNNMEKTKELAERIYYEHGGEGAILAKSEAQKAIDALPDPMIGLYEMNEYGYTYKGMLPLTQERALELFEQDLSLYVLHEDGTETMVEDREQIMEHSGIFGIEKDEWQLQKGSREVENQNKHTEQTENNSVQEKLSNKEDVKRPGNKESVLGKLKLFKNKAKELNEAREAPTRNKETGIDK